MVIGGDAGKAKGGKKKRLAGGRIMVKDYALRKWMDGWMDGWMDVVVVDDDIKYWALIIIKKIYKLF